jgi:hypothetical protein
VVRLLILLTFSSAILSITTDFGLKGLGLAFTRAAIEHVVYCRQIIHLWNLINRVSSFFKKKEKYNPFICDACYVIPLFLD